MSNETSAPFAITSERKIRTTIGATVTMIAAVVIGTWTVGRYASNMEKALEELQAEVKSMRSEMVMRGPFYAWAGHQRFLVSEAIKGDATLQGFRGFPSEPRSFLEPYRTP
jgi:hypothetical protein